MARKGKVNKNSKGNSTFGKRSYYVKDVRKYYLIVCEGKKTEPNYFEGLKKDTFLNKMEVAEIKVEGTGFNTDSLVEEALRIREEKEVKYLKEYELCIVFDRDSFPPEKFNNAITECEQISKSERKKRTTKVRAYWTNEAFELWYLLHFDYHTSELSRDLYKGKIEQSIRYRGINGGDVNFVYKKNDETMYSRLKEYQSIAIKNAKKLEAQHGTRTDYANMNPCTKVHHLVAELLGKK